MLPHVVTAPDAEPVTLDEAKAHLRIDGDDDKEYISALITAARTHAERHCWRGFVEQTLELVLEQFPCGDSIELVGGNLESVTSVTYVDDDGASQTLATSEYVTDTVSEPGRLLLAYDKSWPSTRAQWDAVKVRYVVGWDVDEVPQPIKQAVLLLVSQMFEHRTPEVFGQVSSVSFAVDALLAPYRLVKF